MYHVGSFRLLFYVVVHILPYQFLCWHKNPCGIMWTVHEWWILSRRKQEQDLVQVHTCDSYDHSLTRWRLNTCHLLGLTCSNFFARKCKVVILLDGLKFVVCWDVEIDNFPSCKKGSVISYWLHLAVFFFWPFKSQYPCTNSPNCSQYIS